MEAFSMLLALCEGNPLVTGEFPSQKASDAELWCFLWSVPEQTVDQTIEMPVIWDTIALIMTSLNDTEPIVTQFTDTYMSPVFNELIS